MLGRLIYIAIFVAVVLAGGAALDFLASEQGNITLDYGDRLYEITLFEGAILLVLGALVLWLAIWVLSLFLGLFRFLVLGDENGLGGRFAMSRERKGLDALGRSLSAIAAGDARTARRNAEYAESHLVKMENPGLTRLVNAQAADMDGDRQRAATYYKALMSEKETAFVGTRGLLHHALADGDTDRALKLASHARDLKPRDKATLDALYMLQSQKFDWAGARKTLASQVKAGHLSKKDANTREASLILAQSEDAERLGEHEHARALALEAAKTDPANVEAVTKASGHLIGAGSKRAASKLILDSWRRNPNPKLAAAFAEVEPDESPAQRRRRFETLFAIHPEHPETHFLKAELSLVAEDYVGARRSIEALRETELSARSCAIMAAIARGEGEPDHIVRGWLARALGAPRDEASETQISHAAMLPLLIGPSKAEAEAEERAAKERAAARREAEKRAATEDVEDAETNGDPDDLAPEVEPPPSPDTEEEPRPNRAEPVA